MKTTLLLLLAVTSLNQAFAQGTVNFANSAQNPIYQADGKTPLDNSYEVGLYFVLGGFFPNDSELVPGSVTPITGNGIFSGPTLTLSGYPPLSGASVQVAVWNTSFGATFGQVFLFDPLLTGASGNFEIILGGGGRPPANLPMPSFTLLGPIPEPGTLALWSLGSLVLIAQVLRNWRAEIAQRNSR